MPVCAPQKTFLARAPETGQPGTPDPEGSRRTGLLTNRRMPAWLIPVAVIVAVAIAVVVAVAVAATIPATPVSVILTVAATRVPAIIALVIHAPVVHATVAHAMISLVVAASVGMTPAVVSTVVAQQGLTAVISTVAGIGPAVIGIPHVGTIAVNHDLVTPVNVVAVVPGRQRGPENPAVALQENVLVTRYIVVRINIGHVVIAGVIVA